MKIELCYSGGTVTVAAISVDPRTVDRQMLVASAQGPDLATAVKVFVSRFVEMQRETIEALNASGIVHYVMSDDKEQLS